MIILGITGGSGTGKTTVSNILKNNGVDVIDTDIVARKIVEPGTPALFEIKEYFGKDIVDEKIEIDNIVPEVNKAVDLELKEWADKSFDF